jgi:hypothetical protein
MPWLYLYMHACPSFIEDRLVVHMVLWSERIIYCFINFVTTWLIYSAVSK